MTDVDDDDYGDAAAMLPVVAGTDCDDLVQAVNPGVFEGPMGNAVCSDAVDNDCDTLIDNADPDCNSLRGFRRYRGRFQQTPNAESRLDRSGRRR